MAAKGSRVTVGATAVKLAAGKQKVHVRNRDATSSVDLGGPTVAAGAGYELRPGEELTLDLGPDDLYAVSSGAVRVDVLALRKID
jgi:hypothetical protein